MSRPCQASPARMKVSQARDEQDAQADKNAPLCGPVARAALDPDYQEGDSDGKCQLEMIDQVAGITGEDVINLLEKIAHSRLSVIIA